DGLAVVGRDDRQLGRGAGTVGGGGRRRAGLRPATLPRRRVAARAARGHQGGQRERRRWKAKSFHWITCSNRASVRSPSLEVAFTAKDQRPGVRFRLEA